MRKKIIDAIENINFYVMIVLGGLAFVYTIGNTINIFENIEWLQDRYEAFILLLLSNIVIHLISDHYGKIEEIQKSCKEVEENLVPGLEKKINYNTNEVRENLINIFQQELKLLYYKDENLLHSVVDNIEKVRLTLFQDDLEMKKYLIRLLKKCKSNVMDLTERFNNCHNIKKQRKNMKNVYRKLHKIKNIKKYLFLTIQIDTKS